MNKSTYSQEVGGVGVNYSQLLEPTIPLIPKEKKYKKRMFQKAPGEEVKP